MPSERTRPKVGYRLPLNQEHRRRQVIELAEQSIQQLDVALDKLGHAQPEVQIDIVKVIRRLDSIRNHMIAAQYGPEQPEG